jgi:hypothetical protein
VAAGGSNGGVKLIDVTKRLEVGSLKGAQGLLAFLPDGNTLISVEPAGLRAWRAAPFFEADAPLK